MENKAIPAILDEEAHQRFESLFREHGWQADHRFSGGYVEHVWANARPLIEAFAGPLGSKRVLEFGCNYGASAIVLSHLGAVVTAVDVDANFLQIAQANAARFGDQTIVFQQVPESGALPFADASFDLITCISVLEYVKPSLLVARLRDFDRLLKPGGTLLIMGTSSRLAPRELHSRRWLVNYLPRWVDDWTGQAMQRGVAPWLVARAFPNYADLVRADGGRRFIAAKRDAGATPAKLVALTVLSFLAQAIGTSVGSLLPSFFFALRKPD